NQNHLHKKMVNEIANRAFITRDSNYKISNTDPLTYLPTVEEEYPGSLEKQFIPQNRQLWKIENYGFFLQERRKIIADQINQYLGELKGKYLGEKSDGDTDWFEVIEKGENDYVEFKESLRWDYKSKEELKKSEYIALRAIASFLNSGGGKLFIGVADDGTIKGIEKDYQTFNPNRTKQDSDGFKLHLDNLINQYLGDIYHAYISVNVQPLNGNEICIIEVSPSDGPVYLRSKDQFGNKKEEFFIRRSASSIALGLRDSNDYIKINWNN
ncbi:RNA-binding domain-containing protein, partial [Methanocalculus sp.]|uniref:AlbA family DNA-binding domain-containing protein n=1 Tax=Methanocalculus sp. TaxID=2004547 RepID=UPI00261C837F